MFGKKKLLEERIGAAIRAEFAGLIAELEREHQRYSRWWRLKEEARVTLEEAEATVSRMHLERIALKEQFWEAYYGNDEAALSRIEREHRSLERAIRKAERFLKKAHANFEKADFDEVAEGSVLKEKADAAREKADLRVSELEKTLEGMLAETWRDVKEASEALRKEVEEPGFDTSEEEAPARPLGVPNSGGS